ncbi:GLPGLI family protein [Halpernia frigidisoli]|uniref:GLPGLI family protein n=1 Tax=Halpernia frigidisoli TaxID=1125876 RepID=A0A1I3FZE7_9FLAO|nr:GLPGLI family protein [Halpernia frigidisoli]SFI16586.1 GLPGLI family protein [Halpernia frigidisoli]
MIYLKFALFFFPIILLSQETTFPKDFKMRSSAFLVKNYDESILNVYYIFNSIDKSNLKGKSVESVCILQIGKNFSKFSDTSRLRLDSLMTKYSRQDNIGSVEINDLLRYKILWSGVSLKDFKEKKVTHQNTVAGKIYQYDEGVPEQIWQLKNEVKIVLGYKCNKAILKYRGRIYTAWYAREISINNGPYIFQGLPGLILEIQDQDNYVHFTAKGIDRKLMDIYLENNQSILNVNREKYREIRKNYFDNPSAFIYGTAYNQDGTPIISKPIHTSVYNPLELE